MFLVWTTIIPIIGGLICYWVGRRNEKLRDALVLLFTVIPLAMVLSLFRWVPATGAITYSYPKLLPPFGLSFRLDWLCLILATITSVVWLLVTIHSFDYMKHLHDQSRYHAFTLITFGAILGTFFSGDLVTLFLFFELMSLSSFVLVIHEGHQKAMKAGFLYLIMTIGGGLSLLFGIIAVSQMLGSVSFYDQGVLNINSPLSLGAFIAFLAGFGMKAGMFPLHIWLPEAHPVAPSPASALLSGVMLKVGAFGLLRVLYNLYDKDFLLSVGWNNILLIIAAITIILGSVYAILQTDLKRRLAYSSVSQLGYILLGMSQATEQALVGDIFHIFAHAMMKSCLFMAAGAIIMQSGKRDVSELNGIGHKMPLTMIAFTMAALAMIGIPPFNGFLSKWLLGLGALDAGRPIYVVVLLASSLLNGLYYFPIIINAFFKPESEELVNTKETPTLMLIPIVLLALGTILFDIIPTNWPLTLSEITAKFLLGGGPGV